MAGERGAGLVDRAGMGDDFEHARWYVVRPAANRKPSTYRCPLCGRFLPALSAHMLVVPEGESSRRRHAHTGCVLRARESGRLPLREDVHPPKPGPLARLLRRRRSST
jgi:hypothetical protein